MELQRREYPALLDSLQPNQAVNVLNDRMRHVSQLNAHIADWLQERRRVEELYVQGLRKLANKHPPDDTSDLGVFTTPWQKIVSATEAIAESHHVLARNIEADVERPLRDFAASNREVQAMSTISGNLSAMAKEIDTAKKKAEKLREKGAKAQASKVASAVAEVESATSQWESQAPYVFEKLQAVDESRVNHLRDVLTQFQTHEVDQVERNRITAEETLNALLNIETSEEIRTYVLRLQTGEVPHVARKQSSVSSPPRNLAPPTSAPSTHDNDDRSQKSGSVNEHKHSGLQSLKRFGTVLGRRKSGHPYGRSSSPDRKSSTNLSSAFSGFGKKKDRDMPSPAPDRRPVSPMRRLSTPKEEVSPRQMRHSGDDRRNGTLAVEPVAEPIRPATATNGTTHETIPELNELNEVFVAQQQQQSQPQPQSQVQSQPEPQKDAEGFSVPPSALDAITAAEREAAMLPNESSAPPQFKLDIRNAPIQEEEDGDADAALANLANTLRAQAAPPKRASTLRGRRDVRNTIFVPSPNTPELTSIGETIPPLPSSAPGSGVSAFPAPAMPSVPTPTSPPFRAHKTHLSDDHPASDTQSVMSGRSLASSSSNVIKHPELHEPGLSASLVEAVSTWFEAGKVTKAMVIGQVALAFNPVDVSTGPFGTENIRLDNFPVLEKVAPNPVFIEQAPDAEPGNYTVDLSKILKTTVAFHYQLHLDADNLACFSPLILRPTWKCEATQSSAILHYSLNPAFNLGGADSVTLHNLVLLLRLEPGAKVTGCQSKPPGSSPRDKSLIYWRLGDVTFTRDQPAQSARVRFFTDGEAKAGNAEARWEIAGQGAVGVGSGLGVSMAGVEKENEKEKEKDEVDPFADEQEKEKDEEKEKERERETLEGEKKSVVVWRPVHTVKRITSGTYTGV